MRVWYVQSRAGALATAAFVLIVGSGLLWFGAFTVIFGLSSESDAVANGVRIAVTSAMGLLWLCAGIGHLRAVLEITVTERGTMILVRAIGSTQLVTGDIWKMDSQCQRDEDGDPFWKFRFWYGNRGLVVLDQFGGATDFRDTVLASNPNATITGVWPWPTSVPSAERSIYWV